MPADDLALLTHRLDRRSYLHGPFRCLNSAGWLWLPVRPPLPSRDARRALAGPKTRPASIARTFGPDLRRSTARTQLLLPVRTVGRYEAGTPAARLPASLFLRRMHEANAAAGRCRRGAGVAGPAGVGDGRLPRRRQQWSARRHRRAEHALGGHLRRARALHARRP